MCFRQSSVPRSNRSVAVASSDCLSEPNSPTISSIDLFQECMERPDRHAMFRLGDSGSRTVPNPRHRAPPPVFNFSSTVFPPVRNRMTRPRLHFQSMHEQGGGSRSLGDFKFHDPAVSRAVSEPPTSTTQPAAGRPRGKSWEASSTEPAAAKPTRASRWGQTQRNSTLNNAPEEKVLKPEGR